MQPTNLNTEVAVSANHGTYVLGHSCDVQVTLIRTFVDDPTLWTLVESVTRRSANGSPWPRQRTPPMALEAQPSHSTSWFCVTANGPVCLDSPCVQSSETRFTCRCANQVESSSC